MIEIFVWNPLASKNAPFSSGLGALLKSGVKGESIGHMSLGVTVYEDTHNLSALRSEFSALEFENAMRIYESVRTDSISKGVEYKRGKQLKGITTVSSFWPTVEITTGFAIKSFFGKLIGRRLLVEPGFSDIRKDMIQESDNQDTKIHHHVKYVKSSGEFKSQRSEELKQLIANEDEFLAQSQALNIKLKQMSQEVAAIKSKFPEVLFRENYESNDLGNVKAKLKLSREKARVIYIKGHGNVEDRNGNEFANSMDYKKLQEKLLQSKTRESEAAKEFNQLILQDIQHIDHPSLTNLIKEYREVNRILDYLTYKQDSYSMAKIEINQLRLTVIRSEILRALEELSSPALQSVIASATIINTDIDSAGYLVNKYQTVIAELDKIKQQAKDIQVQKDNLKVSKKQTVLKQEELRAVINNREVTEGRNADFVVSLPTSESGKRFYIDELKVLAYMENQRTNKKYELFAYNCASSVKHCILAGISNSQGQLDEELVSRIKQIPGVPHNFFKQNSRGTFTLDTPNGEMRWLLKFTEYLKTINQQYEQELKQTQLQSFRNSQTINS